MYGSPTKQVKKAGAPTAAPEPPKWLTLEKCIQYRESWAETTSQERTDAIRDVRYYHSKQWTDEDIEKLERRKQPVITKNRLARKVNTMLGEEVKKNVDPEALPRTRQHEHDGRAATDGLRFVAQEQGFRDLRHDIYFDLTVPGICGVIIGGGDPEEITAPLTHVPYDRLWWDPASRKLDFSDAKYKGAGLWFDLDDAIEQWPDKEDELRKALSEEYVASTDDNTADKPMWLDSERQRIMVCEVYCYYRGNCFKAVFTRSAFIEEPHLTGYLDEKGNHVCPLEMQACFIDDELRHYGVLRSLISPQDELNKSASKLMHSRNVTQILREQGAVLDPHNARIQLSRPDGDIELQPNALRDQRFQVRTNSEQSQWHAQAMQQAITDIDSIGPASSNIPELPNSASGVAFDSRVESASKETAPILERLRNIDLRIFKQDWWRIRQFKTDEWWLRVTDDRELNGWRFSALNRPMTRAQRFEELTQKGAPLESALEGAAGQFAPMVLEDATKAVQSLGQQIQPDQADAALGKIIVSHPFMQEQITAAQVAQLMMDIVLDESPGVTVQSQRQYQEMVKMAPALQQSGFVIPPEFWIEASSLPDKRRLRELVAKANKPDPAKQKLAEENAALQLKLQQAEIALLAAKAQESQANAAAKMPEAQTKQLEASSKAGTAKAGAMVDLVTVAKTQAETEKIRAETANLQQPTVVVTGGRPPWQNS